MSVIRINKTENYTVMSNHHFKEREMSLKAKGMLSLMLSLPDSWDYTVSGLTTLSKDGKDGVMSALAELEKFGYLTRTRLTNSKGKYSGIEYNIFEEPQREKPVLDKPISANENTDKPISENAGQLNTNSINHLINQLYILLNTNDVELIELYQKYINVRENINAPLNEISLGQLIKRCKRLAKNNIKIEKVILETAIVNGWKNVYLPRETELTAINREITDDLKAMFGLE